MVRLDEPRIRSGARRARGIGSPASRSASAASRRRVHAPAPLHRQRAGQRRCRAPTKRDSSLERHRIDCEHSRCLSAASAAHHFQSVNHAERAIQPAAVVCVPECEPTSSAFPTWRERLAHFPRRSIVASAPLPVARLEPGRALHVLGAERGTHHALCLRADAAQVAQAERRRAGSMRGICRYSMGPMPSVHLPAAKHKLLHGRTAWAFSRPSPIFRKTPLRQRLWQVGSTTLASIAPFPIFPAGPAVHVIEGAGVELTCVAKQAEDGKGAIDANVGAGYLPQHAVEAASCENRHGPRNAQAVLPWQQLVLRGSRWRMASVP